MQIDKPSMSMYASLEDYRKALAEWQWQLGVVAFHGIDTEAETDGVFVVIGTTDPEVFAQEIQKAKLLRESKDDEGYEHDAPLQAWAALQDGVWNFDASEDTPGAYPALVANLRWELSDDDQPSNNQCSGCNVPKNGLYQIAEPSTSATPAIRQGAVYISGPMTGIADLNFPAFNSAAELLRGQGRVVVNPAEYGVIEGAQWADYLRADLAQLLQCEAIYLLPGWSKSRGAKLEHHVATALGLRVEYADGAEREGQGFLRVHSQPIAVAQRVA